MDDRRRHLVIADTHTHIAPLRVPERSEWHHVMLAFSHRHALEYHREPVAAWRGPLCEERGLPPTATALVEQIRERLLVLTRGPRELHHDGLVFFHEMRKY